MIKLLLADDEPLVLLGLQSMLKWEDYNIEICGVAHNGEQAIELIEKNSPDIVIMDIKMPVKSGLDVMKYCNEKFGRLPLFIMLTSFEKYEFVKEAINYQAVDYLVKFELTPEVLSKSIAKAIDILRTLKKDDDSAAENESNSERQLFYEKFFIRLLNNLFDNEEQYKQQATKLGLDFSYDCYVASYCEISVGKAETMSSEKLFRLYSSTTKMVQGTVRKYVPCYLTALDVSHFSIIFCLDKESSKNYRSFIGEILDKTVSIVNNYFSVQLLCSVGTAVSDPYYISESFYSARMAFSGVNENNPVAFYDNTEDSQNHNEIFDFSKYKENITKAYEELDADALYELITDITNYFTRHQTHRIQAMDAACNLLFMSISMFPDGEKAVCEIFSDNPDGFRSLYKMLSTNDIIAWMTKLRDGLVDMLKNHKHNYKEIIVENVKKYIRKNINTKLTLNEVSAFFGFSPNYLSQLFIHYSDCGFVEYVTQEKIQEAKRMMLTGNMKIYEIAESLGFENAFYFSKVFKKVEGCSPSEYLKSRQDSD